MSRTTLGVLVMAYGTPKHMDEVEAYYTHIRHGRKPTPELLDNLISRYEAIGGVSPLNEITTAQAEGIQAALDASDRRRCKVYLGMKHTEPFIEDVVRQMADDGITQAVTLVLAPHYSSMSVGAYQKTAEAAAAACGGPEFWHVNSWHLEPAFINLLSHRVTAAIAENDATMEPTVIFSAHSLPERILEQNDPYPEQLHATGDAVAAQLHLSRYTFAWQSAGRTAEPWLGPDILDVIRQLHGDGQSHVVVCSAGFVSDHLEVLYDIDIECQALADQLGITLTRTASLNADPNFVQMLAAVVRQREQEIEVARR